MYINTTELPAPVQKVLTQVNYKRKDILLEFKDEASLSVSGGKGYRGFTAIINIETGVSKITEGSWGGANMFNPTNPVDLDTKPYKLPENCAVIMGSHGDGATRAHVIISVANAPKYLSSGASSVTDKEKKILYCFKSLKSGPYRKDALNTVGANETEINSLIERGMLIKDGRGIRISVEGKNNAGNNYY